MTSERRNEAIAKPRQRLISGSVWLRYSDTIILLPPFQA